MIKYIPLCFILLAGCATKQVALLSQQEEYPELEVGDVKVQSHAPVPETCKQISVIITNPQEDVIHILNELRQNAATVGGNLVNIDSMGYMTDSAKENKYATATVYLCR